MLTTEADAITSQVKQNEREIRRLRVQMDKIAAGGTLRATAIGGVIPGANSPVEWYFNANLLGLGDELELHIGGGVWISASFAAGRAHYLIGAYCAPPCGGGGGATGTVGWYANGGWFCDALEFDLQQEGGVWISGVCVGGDRAVYHVGAYPVAGGGGLSGVSVALEGADFCFAGGLDFHQGAGVWISGVCVAGQADVTIGAYPEDLSPYLTGIDLGSYISGVDFGLNDGPICFGQALDLHEAGGVWISASCAAGEAEYDIGAYPATPDILAERATQVIAAATTITVTDGLPVTPFTTAGNVTNTAAPFIAAGRDGQLVILRNDNGSGTLTVSDTNIGAGGSLLRLSANTITMAAGSSMALVYSTIQAAWVEEWYLALVAVTPAINTHTINIGAGAANAQNAEVANAGTHSPTFAWTYTGVPSEGTVDVSAGGDPGADYPATILTPFTSLIGPAFNKGTSVGTVRTFTPTIKVNGVWKTTPTATVTYINRRYMGPSAQPAALTTAQVLGLDADAHGTSALSTINTGSFSVNIEAGEYLWYAYRAALGAGLYLTLNGEIADFVEKQTDLDHTNDSGFEEHFRTWRATIAAVGAVTAVVATSEGTNRFYMGPAVNGTDDISNAEILALDDTADGESGLYSSQARTWTAIKIEAGEYLWYCHPDRVADLATIKDGTTGFAIAGSYRNNVNHTNQYGYVETYRCWRSDNPGIYPAGENVVIT